MQKLHCYLSGDRYYTARIIILNQWVKFCNNLQMLRPHATGLTIKYFITSLEKLVARKPNTAVHRDGR